MTFISYPFSHPNDAGQRRKDVGAIRLGIRTISARFLFVIYIKIYINIVCL